MQKLNEVNLQPGFASGNMISVSDLLATLWRARRTVAALTSLAVLLGGAAALYTAKYKSDGFLQFGGAIPLRIAQGRDKLVKDKEASSGIMLADYKRYAAAFTTSGRFDEFVRQNKLDGTEGVDGLRRAFATGAGISKLVEPIYPFTKLDAKELMEQPKDGSNNVIGLRINYEASTPESAQRMVGLLGRYTVDSIVYMIYSDTLRFKHGEITAKITKLDNDIIDYKEKLEEYRRKGATLKQIVARYPDSASQAARQVVSITEENSRYLSPVTHLMSTEVEALSVSEIIIGMKREQKQSLLLREYYDQAKSLLDANKSGELVLLALESVKERVFKDKDLDDELVREVYNTISIENQTAINVYLEKTRFIAGPSLPGSRSTHLSTALVISFLFGLVGSSLLVLLAKWWRDNSEKLRG